MISVAKPPPEWCSKHPRRRTNESSFPRNRQACFTHQIHYRIIMKTLLKTTLVATSLILLSLAGVPVFSTTAFAADAPAASPSPTATAPMPRLVDLGATKCIPCKMMAPILEGLKKEYEGRMQVDFIDVWQNPDAGKKYAIKMIPTQIFYDAAGKELFRHEGFFAKDDILAKWKELGVNFGEKKGAL